MLGLKDMVLLNDVGNGTNPEFPIALSFAPAHTLKNLFSLTLSTYKAEYCNHAALQYGIAIAIRFVPSFQELSTAACPARSELFLTWL